MSLNDYTFIGSGFRYAGQIFNVRQCGFLLAEALASREFQSIFLSEAEWRANPQRRGNNPRPGRNLAEKCETNFIFSSEAFRNEMTKVCGPRWRVLDYKFVMGYPDHWIPGWLKAELGDRPVANLGEYVQEKYRDITYFRGIDFHQDIIDWPDRPADFITAYIYLDDVGPKDSPLYVLPYSHCVGAQPFPHPLSKNGDGTIRYENAAINRGFVNLDLTCLTGPGGSLYYWHPFVLHGTQPQANDRPRVSLRLLIDKNARADCGCELDQVNARIQGAKSLDKTQDDIDGAGRVVKFGNVVNRI